MSSKEHSEGSRKPEGKTVPASTSEAPDILSPQSISPSGLLNPARNIDPSMLNPRSLLQIQRSLGNGSVGNLLSRARMSSEKGKPLVPSIQENRKSSPVFRSLQNNSGKKPYIQRMIISDNMEKDDQYQKVRDFLIKNQGIQGNIVKPGEEVNLTQAKSDEPIYVIQHGSAPGEDKQGTIMGQTPQMFFAMLKKMGFNPQKHTGDIVLYSCYSAFKRREEDTTFAQVLSQILKENGYKGSVSGVNGTLNPFDKRKEDTEESLWQGDPNFIRIKKIKDSLWMQLDEMNQVVEHLDRDKYSKRSKLRKNALGKVKTYLKHGLYALESCDFTIKELDKTSPTVISLKKWREETLNLFIEVNSLIGDHTRLNELEKEKRLKLKVALEKLTGPRRKYDFQMLEQRYIKERSVLGDRTGAMNDSVFKKLDLVKYS